MHDGITVGEQSPAFAQNAFNVFWKDGAFYGRPGLAQNATQLGTVSGRQGQCVHWHTATDGTMYRFLVCGGKLYTWDGNVSHAPTDVTPAGVTIDASNRVYMVSFGDDVVVNDEVHRPWILSNPGGTPVTGTYIDLDSAGSGWIARGRPTIYGAKAFFILKSIAAGTFAGSYGNAIVWSEEDSPSTGYRQTNFANFWQLTQTSTDQLYAIHGTEAYLYYFRARAIGAIAGKVNSDFITASTQDAVSLTVGTKYPATVVQTDKVIWFADELGRPYRLPIGEEPIPAWDAMANICFTNQFNSLAANAQAMYDPDLNVVRFALSSDTDPAVRMYCFDGATGNYIGQHGINATAPSFAGELLLSGIYLDVIGVLPDGSGYPLFVALGTSGTTLSTANRGYLWQASAITNGQFEDRDSALTPLTTYIGVVSHLVANAADMEFRAAGITAEIATKGIGGRSQAATLTYITPRYTSNFLTSSALVGSGLMASDPQLLSTLGHVRIRYGMGPNCVGRWIRLMVLITASQFYLTAFERITLTGSYRKLNPYAA